MHVLARSTAAVALALALAGCKTSKTSGASCGTGETGNADPAFCFKVPAGLSQRGDPVKRPDRFSIAYADDGKAKLEVIARELDGWEGRWKALQANAQAAKATDAKEEDFAGGKGKLLTYTTPEKDPRFLIVSILRGEKKSLECVAEYRTSAPKKDLVDACKSLREP